MIQGEAAAGGGSAGLERFFSQTQAMACRHGVDLLAAARQGLLNRAEVSRMVEACLLCNGPAPDCAPPGAASGRADKTPQGCANAGIIDGLRGLV